MALVDHWNGIDDALTTSSKSIAATNAIIPVGSFVAISICMNAGSTTASCSDGQGNTYTAQGAAVTNGANSVTHLVLTSKITTQVPANNTFSFTLGATRLRFTAAFGVFDDVVSGTLDGTRGTGTNTGTSVAPAASGDPATTRSLTLLSGGCQSNVTFSVAGSQALVDIAREGTSSGERTAFLSYEYVTNPGTQAPTGTLSLSSIWCAEVTNFDASSSGITGTGAVTNAGDTVSGTGSEVLLGTGAVVDGNDTTAGSGAEVFTGTGSVADANDTPAGVGAEVLTGTGAVTNAADAAAGSGLEVLTGTGGVTDGDDIASGSGSVTSSAIVGSGTAVNADDSTSATGTVGTVNWFATPTVRRRAGEKRLYNLYTLNKGVSVVLIDGHYRRYPIPPHTMLLPLVAGRDYFIGGTAAVVVSDAVAAALTADGFTVYDHNPDED